MRDFHEKQKEIYDSMFGGLVGRTIHEVRLILKNLHFKPYGVEDPRNDGFCTFRIARYFDLELFYDEETEMVEKITIIKY